MACLIQTYYEQAQLSDAAYTTLIVGMTVDDYEQALRDRGFTTSEATAFAATYSILNVYEDPATSFYAVLFQKNGTNEKMLSIRGTNDIHDLLITDLSQLALTGLTGQNGSLVSTYADILQRVAPTNTFTITGHSLGGFLAQIAAGTFPEPIAHIYTYNAPGLNSAFSNLGGLFGFSRAIPNNLITNLVGQGQTFVASTGTQLGGKENIFIEEVSLLVNPVANHLIAPLKESLALYALFAAIDTTADQKVSSITEMLKAASRTPALSLEQTLDSLRRLFLGPNITGTPLDTPAAYYDNVTALKTNPSINGSARVFSLANLSDSSIAGLAKLDIAYRYALQELNPFAVIGADYTVHSTGGALDLYDTQSGNGTMTALYLSDRAGLLAKRLAVNVNDGDTFPTDTHYVDLRTGFEVGSVASASEVLFGDAQDNRDLTGHAGGDHLYGGDGNDLLMGQGGQDYLEGNAGNDELYGGTENDILLGQQGNDQLYGEADHDRLNGGLGDDRLEGGTGLDTYFYRTGQGLDRIVDADQSGAILFDNQTLVGGIRRQGTPADTYTSPDGQFTFVKSGADLIVNNTLTIENFDFQNGALGIKLADAGDLVDETGPTINYANGQPTVRYDGDATDNTPIFTAAANHEAYGFGGNDFLDLSSGSAAFNHQIFGGTGIDELNGGAGQDRAYGESGSDSLGGGGGDDVLVGGDGWDLIRGDLRVDGSLPSGVAGQDVLQGEAGRDFLEGNAGDDVLLGGADDDFLSGDDHEVYLSRPVGDDYLDGGAGADVLWGSLGNDVIVGGTENDRLYGDNHTTDRVRYRFVPGSGVVEITPNAGPQFYSTSGGADYLDGEAGDDYLQGDAGDDVLLGGEGADELWGDDQQVAVIEEGDDWLEGGLGNDQLVGGGGEDALFGGDDDDALIGDYVGDATQGVDDTLDGGSGNDELQGGGGDDLLDGGSENDTLFGNDGDDSLYGGTGDDQLQGGEGDDVLVGEEGVDVLFGQEGNDLLFGDEGNDQLIGDAGADELGGGEGDDFLIGGADDDVLFGDEGNDELQGGLGADLLAGDDGDDRLFGEEGADELFGDNGADVLVGGADADVLFGGGGNDQLLGDDGDDQLSGDEGVDILVGGSGADILEGGQGNDSLSGDAGGDTYHFGLGDGADAIIETAGEGNRLVLGPGISAESIRVGVGANDSLIMRFGSGSDSIFLANFGASNVAGLHTIDTFQLSDGTIVPYSALYARGFLNDGTGGPDLMNGTDNRDEVFAGAGNDTVSGLGGDDALSGEDGNDQLFGGIGNDSLNGGSGNDIVFGEAGVDQLFGGTGDDIIRGGDGNDVLTGEAGNDSLEGETGDDVLVGGAGDDQLYGGEGSDTYHFNLGDGLDSVFDSGSGTDTDTVVFGSGITSNSVSLSAQFGQIIIRVGPGSEGIQSGSVFDVFGSQTIERFQFADGTEMAYADLVARGFDIDGTEFDDFLLGTNLADRFQGGFGNDRLEGGEGHDAYVFNVGDGLDTIVDTAVPGAANEIVFGPGIASSDLRLDLVPDQSDPSLDNLLLRFGTNGDAIQLDTFDRNNVFGPRTVEVFRFADGSSLTYEQLLARGFDLTGTTGNDQLMGTNTTDRMTGLDGADVLKAGAGDDQLDGGVGNDRLYGGQGNDTYLFGPGSGHDTMVEFQGSLDAIRMAPGVAPSDVVATRNHHDLVLSLNGGADRLTVSGYFLATTLQIERVEFGDGTVWSQAFIENLVRPTITGTAGDDVLVGTSGDDRLFGLAGSDELSGLAGNDHLDGGTGADTMAGGIGDDAYIVDEAGDIVTESANEGTETVQSAVSYQLSANVENLTLTGTAAITGTGNELDNVLTGNSSASVLTGGQGDDTYVVGVGDTVVESVGEGTDTVQSSSDVTLGANLENLALTGSASLTGIGNSLNNVLQADGSISVLAGGDGNDTYLIGPNGDDDILVETATGGIDTVVVAHDYRLPTNIENLTLRDPRVPDFASFSLIPYGSTEQQVAGYGNELNNMLVGGRANNVLDGGLGADTLIGGAGNDSYIVDHVGDTVVEQAHEGIDTVLSTVNHQLSAHVENLTLIGPSTGSGQATAINGTGNALNNELRGNEAANVLDGGGGDDGLQGLGGADTYLFGRGSGRDIVFDSSVTGDIDTIELAADLTPADVAVYRRDFGLVLVINGTTDELTLASFFDQPEYAQKQVRFADGTVWNEAELQARAVTAGSLFTGTADNDTLVGSAGHDVLVGETDDDVLTGGLGNDWLYGDTTNPPPVGQQAIGNDRLIGGPGDDVLIDFTGTNLFDGGLGADTLSLGSGQETILFGRGMGNDSVQFDRNGSDIDIVQMSAELAPADVVLTRRPFTPNIVDITIRETGETLTLNLSTDFFTIDPTATQARVIFADGTQWNVAPFPVDVPMASAGDDLLSASFPATLAGLAGDDTYLFGSSGIPGTYAVIEAPGEGIDTVQSLFDYALDPQVENLILAESASSALPNAERGSGNELDNLIIGNTGDNILDGGAGNDVLVGGIVRELEGTPYVTGTGSDILIGGAGDDVLMEDAGNFSLAGGSLFLHNNLDHRYSVPRVPDDLLIGGTGNDTYIVHSQQQTVAEFEHEGIDTVRSTVSYVLGDHIENLMLLENPVMALPGPIAGTGNDLDNVLMGNSEDNVLSGGAGNDTLWGGKGIYRDTETIRSGDDALVGGTGHDTYVFNVGDGIDTIEDTALAGEGNRIQFGGGIRQSDLTFTHDETARTVTIQVRSSGTDRLILTNFDPTGTSGSFVVETFAFADGSTANLATLLGGSVNQAPTVENPLADQTVPEGTPVHLQIPAQTFADVDVGDTLTYSASVADGTALPAWLSFDPTTRTFTGTPDDAQVGSLNLRVTATDTGDLSVSDVFTLTVQNVNDAPTVAVPLTDQTAAEDEPFSFTVPGTTFTDVDAGDALSYSAALASGAALPIWLTFDPLTRTFTGTPGPGDEGLLQLAVTATDTGNLSATDEFTLAISGPLPKTFVGTAGNDMLTGARGDDTLTGGTGNDTLAGGAGNDTYLFNIGDGVDTITDTSLPGEGNVLQFGVGITANDLSLGVGSFLIRVGTNSDALHLSTFDPTHVLGPRTIETFRFADGTVLSYDQLVARGFELTGTTGNDTITGTSAMDRISGLEGSDTLITGAGDDVLDGGGGTDTMRGETGSDTYIVDATGDVVVELADEGTDTVQTSLLTYTLGANVENLTLTGAGPSAGIGNALSNQLTGNSEANLLDGKAGADAMAGGAGNDLYVVDQAGDVVIEAGNEGTDSVLSAISYQLSANVENLMLTGSASIDGTGNALDNVLTGNSASNVLAGLAGNDTYVIGAGDTVVEATNNGTDTVVSSLTYKLAANVEHLTLVGFTAINGTGNELDNVLNGLLNLAGNALTGGAGNDTYVIGSGDTVVEAAGGGTDTVQTSVTYTLGANVEHLTLTGAGAINGTGNALNNSLIGNSANNVLSGAGGNDTLRGERGNDTLNGGVGNDTFSFGRGDGQDLVRDTSGTTDKLLYDSGIDPLDLVISRQANDLRVAVHGSTDSVTVQNWYAGLSNRTETIQAGNGQTLLSAQVDQLIQAMASFSQQTGLTWDQAIDQRPQDVQAVLAASWQ